MTDSKGNGQEQKMANKMVADLLSTRLNEGWPLFSDRNWAKEEGYLGSNGMPTKSGVRLYDDIVRLVKDIDEDVNILLIGDM